MNFRPHSLLAERLNLNDSSRGAVSWHVHAANEFIWIQQGRGIHETSQGSYAFQRGTLHFFAKGQRHRHRSKPKSCLAVSIRVRDESLDPMTKEDRQVKSRLAYLKQRAFCGQHLLSVEKPTWLDVQRLMQRALEEYTEQLPGFNCMLKAIVFELLVKLGRDPLIEYSSVSKKSVFGIVKVLEHLDRNPTDPVMVVDMARLAGMSRSHFHASFAQATGGSLLEYVTRLRLGYAGRLLSLGNDSITDVAFASGFSSLSRFYEVFKNHFRMTPRAYQSLKRGSEGMLK
ncbi:MAG: AraC family transcriptional regulator [Verrucomicrobiota bacterium]